jgi:hypothetical protein
MQSLAPLPDAGFWGCSPRWLKSQLLESKAIAADAVRCRNDHATITLLEFAAYGRQATACLGH